MQIVAEGDSASGDGDGVAASAPAVMAAVMSHRQHVQIVPRAGRALQNGSMCGGPGAHATVASRTSCACEERDYK